jgi:hypothetical protein
VGYCIRLESERLFTGPGGSNPSHSSKKTMKKKDKKQPTTLSVQFATKEMADHFAVWLCESGEQQYWDWMEAREEDETGDITAVSFHYHGAEDETLDVSDRKRYGEFMADNTIRTIAGRLDK